MDRNSVEHGVVLLQDNTDGDRVHKTSTNSGIITDVDVTIACNTSV